MRRPSQRTSGACSVVPPSFAVARHRHLVVWRATASCASNAGSASRLTPPKAFGQEACEGILAGEAPRRISPRLAGASTGLLVSHSAKYVPSAVGVGDSA